MTNYIILLNLKKHPEGGYFSDFYKSGDQVIIPNSQYKALDKRSAGGSIYFLLQEKDISAWHRLRSDEIWHYYDGGSPIDIHVINHAGQYQLFVLGRPDIDSNASLQIAIKAGWWLAAEVRNKGSFGLVGRTASPGMEYQDFELAKEGDFFKKFPNLPGNLLKQFFHSSQHVRAKTFNQSNNHVKSVTANQYIEKLNLEKHIEGGYFGLYYKSDDCIITLDPRYKTNESKEQERRSSLSSIYFLLEKDDFSAWHRLKSDEIWHYYDGDSLIDIHVIDQNREYKVYTLGRPNDNSDASFQVIIKAGWWFAAEARNKKSFGLVGCTVSPGFEYRDFELADQTTMIKKYKEHEAIIKKLSRVPKKQESWTKKALQYTVYGALSLFGLYMTQKYIFSNSSHTSEQLNITKFGK